MKLKKNREKAPEIFYSHYRLLKLFSLFFPFDCCKSVLFSPYLHILRYSNASVQKKYLLPLPKHFLKCHTSCGKPSHYPP